MNTTLIQHTTTNLNYYAASSQICYWVGDYQSIYDNDPGRFILATGRSSASDATSVSTQDGIGGTDTLYAQVFATDGSNNSDWCRATTSFVITSGYQVTDSAEALGVKHVLNPLVFSAIATVNNSSAIQPKVRGILPGLFFSSFSGYASYQWPKFLTFDTKNHIGIRGAFGLYAWVNTEEWYV